MKSFLRTMSFIVIVFCGMMLWAGAGLDGIKAAFSKPYDIFDEDITVEDIKVGDMVSTEVYQIVDYFARLETTTEKNGRITDRDYYYYYMIPVYNEDDEECYIAAKIHEDDTRAWDKVCDDTWAYWNWEIDELDQSVSLEGVVKKLEADGYELMLEYFTEWEYGKEFLGVDDFDDIEDRVLQLVVEPAKASNLKGMVIGCMIGLVAGIVVLVLTFVVGNKKKSGPEVIQPVDTMSVFTSQAYEQTANSQSATQTAATVSGYFDINGTTYMKSDFVVVDDYVKNGNAEAAVNALMDRTGYTRDVAENVVNNWGSYYR